MSPAALAIGIAWSAWRQGTGEDATKVLVALALGERSGVGEVEELRVEG